MWLTTGIGAATVALWASIAFGISFYAIRTDRDLDKSAITKSGQLKHWWGTFLLTPLILLIFSVFAFVAGFLLYGIGSFVQWVLPIF